MSPQDENGLETTESANDYQDDSMANKLSKELNNWRRRRTNGRPNRGERASISLQADAARTIKVRGHETLVLRKPKGGTKGPIDGEQSKR